MWPFSKKNEEQKEEKRNKAAEQQKKYAQYLKFDKRYREVLTLGIATIMNDYIPKQYDSEAKTKLTMNVVNVMMPDYHGGLKKEHVLSNMEKDFLPQPGMLEYWAKSHGFEQIKNNGSKSNSEDVAGKYVLTYYPPIAKSWAERTTSDLEDTTNKNWYSHCKSTIYDDSGKPIGNSNPEPFRNDTNHDATVYAPYDTISYAIDYKKLGLSEKDIKEGFAYQEQGINIMDKDMQDSIFRMKKAGLEQEEIIKLWKDQINITDPNNLKTIEQHLQDGKPKEDITKCDLSKSENKYQYNLQDYSCAIQPTAPILYATAAKINNENLSPQEAKKLREDIGLYNIHDTENYGEITKKFYNQYSNHVISEAKTALNEDIKEFIKYPKEKLHEISKNISNTANWVSAKTRLVFPEMMTVMEDIIHRRENQKSISNENNNNKIQQPALAYAQIGHAQIR